MNLLLEFVSFYFKKTLVFVQLILDACHRHMHENTDQQMKLLEFSCCFQPSFGDLRLKLSSPYTSMLIQQFIDYKLCKEDNIATHVAIIELMAQNLEDIGWKLPLKKGLEAS